jgi:hypothetical protein
MNCEVTRVRREAEISREFGGTAEYKRGAQGILGYGNSKPSKGGARFLRDRAFPYWRCLSDGDKDWRDALNGYGWGPSRGILDPREFEARSGMCATGDRAR